MYFRKSLILQRIFLPFQDDFEIKTFQGLQLNQGRRLHIKFLLIFEQKLTESGKNLNFDQN